MKQPQVTFTIGRITLAKDLVFGVVVLTEDGWIPTSDLDAADKAYCRQLLGNNPTCPPEFAAALN